ncbi:MAG: hypothetical protein ACTSXT_04675 [Candidatus Helarchaeota archaeon]
MRKYVVFLKNKENYEAEEFLNKILSNYEIIPVNIEISRIAAIIKSKTDTNTYLIQTY